MRITGAALAAVLLVTACGPPAMDPDATDQDPGVGSTLHRGNGAEPQSLDPHRGDATPASNIQHDLFEGLVTEAADGTLVPGSAATWQTSADGRVYTFRLRTDGRWSNGDRLTAADFEFALRRAVDPATRSSYAQLLAPIENATAITAGELPVEALAVVAVDDATLRITLQYPATYFIELLAHPMAYPLHRPSLEAWGETFARPGRLVSNGAYMLAEWVVQSHVRLTKNPFYRARDEVAIETVYYHPIESPTTELKRYRAGDLDWTEQVPHRQITWIREHLAEEFHVAPYLGVYYFGFNVERPPFADRPTLRRALSLAIDRQIITEQVTGGGEIPAYTFVPPMPGYTAPTPAWTAWSRERQLAEARRLYADAGFGPDRPLEVEIRYNTNDNHRQMALAIAAMWKQALGVRSRLVNQESKVFYEARRSRAGTEVFRAAWIGDVRDPVNFLDILQSANGQNDTGFADADYDRLLEQAARETDSVRRLDLLSQAEAVMLEDQPILPIYFYVSRRLVKPRVRGWRPNLLDFHPTRHMTIIDD